MNGPISKAVSSAVARVFSRRSAILKIVEEKALGTRLNSSKLTNLEFRKKSEINDILSPFLYRAFMLRTKRLLIAFTKSHEQSCALVSSSVCIVRRSLCCSSGGLDDKMSGKSLPKWIKPEGDGELKLYNSLTREKVNCCYFRLVIFFLGYKYKLG